MNSDSTVSGLKWNEEFVNIFNEGMEGGFWDTGGCIAHRRAAVGRDCGGACQQCEVSSSSRRNSRSSLDIPVLWSRRIVHSIAVNAEVYNLWRQTAAKREKHQRHTVVVNDERYVCVSCVFTHVSRSRTPVSQSFLPCSESSWNLGGVEMFATGAVITAPSIRRPGKKQTR